MKVRNENEVADIEVTKENEKVIRIVLKGIGNLVDDDNYAVEKIDAI